MLASALCLTFVLLCALPAPAAAGSCTGMQPCFEVALTPYQKLADLAPAPTGPQTAVVTAYYADMVVSVQGTQLFRGTYLVLHAADHDVALAFTVLTDKVVVAKEPTGPSQPFIVVPSGAGAVASLWSATLTVTAHTGNGVPPTVAQVPVVVVLPP
jgi:hypothetical protein